jgi:hypothetical protein
MRKRAPLFQQAGGEVYPPDLADKFHAHLDVCAQCRNKPFDLCKEGEQLLRGAVLSKDN